MMNRREILTGAGALIGTTTIAGCSSSDQPETEQTDTQEEDQTTEEEQEQEETTQNAELASFELNTVEFSYTFSALKSNIRATNITEQETDPNDVNIKIDVYNGEENIGSDSQWETVPATYHQDFKLKISDVSKSADNTIDDVSELIVKGKERDEEYVNLRVISGDELRERVND